jgi:hypothetical protein
MALGVPGSGALKMSGAAVVNPWEPRPLRSPAGHAMVRSPCPSLGSRPLVRPASLARGRSGPSGSPQPGVAGQVLQGCRRAYVLRPPSASGRDSWSHLTGACC